MSAASIDARTDPAALLRRLTGRGGGDPANSSYVHCLDDDECAVSEFPVDVFPDAIARYIATGATALNVPTDMIALPLLGFAAGAIGNTVALGVKPGWIERANLWLAIIGEPGSGKSPALDYARAPLDALQKAAWERFAEQLAAWERETAAAKADKTRTEPLPDKPALEHFYSTDATPEALAVILATSPGVAVVRDELVGWVESFDSYKKGGERQSFLSLWAGTPLKVDRVIRGTTFVPRPVVPVIDGIQPDLLTDLAEEANRRDGFVDRMLMVWPEPLPQRWTDDVPDAAARAAVDAVFGKLRARVREDDKAPGSGVVFLSPEARGMFAAWFDENAALVADASGIAQGCFAKFPSHLLRIALVLHALRRPGDVDHVVEPETVAGAIAVVEHLRVHLRRVLPKFAGVGTAKGAGLSTRIMRLLNRAPGEWMARRDLHRGLGNAATGDDLAAALERLSADGSVENRTIPTGARPREESRALPRTYEHMNNPTAAADPNCSYVHMFGGGGRRATPDAEIADDECGEGRL